MVHDLSRQILSLCDKKEEVVYECLRHLELIAFAT